MFRFAAVTAVLSTLLTAAGCQQSDSVAAEEHLMHDGASTDGAYHEVVVEASCGQCQFDMPGSGCDLAVRVDGSAYFVDGTGIDDHGDAHADDGFCNAVRHARVSGRVEGDRFVASRFELLPDDVR
ncbi:MAG: DUF6370 family protein [Planctomycetota bacterium]|jgi:hypothetical protein